MSRGPTTFRQRDLTATLKAVAASRCPVARVRIKNGEIVVEIGNPAQTAQSVVDSASEWDDLLP